MILKGFAFFVLSLFISLAQSQCNNTLMQVFTKYTLGRGDQLNKTFTKIEEKLPFLPNVTHNVEGSDYLLHNIKPTFFYADSKQQSYIDKGTNLIAVVGGFLFVEYDFMWSKNGGSGGSGTGRAFSRSDTIGFVKQIILNQTYAFETLFDYENVTFYGHKTNISRIDPPTTSSETIKQLQALFNDIQGVRTVKVQIEEDIDKSYNYYLNLSLYDQRRIIDEFYEYKWTGDSSHIVIQYEITMNHVTLEPEGLIGLYMEKIVNDTKWHCEHDVPVDHFNPKVYGAQQFITFDLINNTLRYGIQNGALNTDLTRKNWESRFFQFFAGDLYEVIPILTSLYSATEPVLGSCSAVTNGMKIVNASFDTFNVTINTNCQLGIGKQKIANFSIQLTTQIEGIATQKSLNFKVKGFSYVLNINPDTKFIIQNKELADHMVKHSLNRIYETNVFGSGWPLYSRDYPHFLVEDSYVVIYDSSHVPTAPTEK